RRSGSVTCCDEKQNWMIYSGLPGESYAALPFNPAPAGSIRLPKDVLRLRQQMEDAWVSAIMHGHAEEDESAGYALAGDPKTRKVQLAMRDYALQNEAPIVEVLGS